MGLVLLVPLAIALEDGSTCNPFGRSETLSFTLTILVSLLVGTFLQAACRAGRHQQGTREGFAIVTLGWAALTLFGSIPFVINFLSAPGSPPGLLTAFTNAYFEVMSGQPPPGRRS